MISPVNNNRGFTLVELMVVVAIISIIAGISWEYYDSAKLRSQRSDAVVGLTKARAFMEKCYSNYRDYSNAACDLPAELETAPRGLYSIAISSSTNDTYTLQATTQGPQVEDNTDCQIIGITHAGETSSAAAGSTSDKCWPK